ncbi:MAG: DUF2510 domain-containing protein [Acidimicrobiia bacterium]
MGRPPLPPPPLLDPAWYPDPTGRYEARYWDGRKWTSHISHYGATGADPLLRARFDRWWLRGTLRVLMWAGLIGLGWWAFNEYWPNDERDLVADESLATNTVLVITDLPDPTWVVTSAPDPSPLSLTVDAEGAVAVPACEALADVIDDSADEPVRRQAFAASDGATAIAARTVIGGGADFGETYLDALRTPEAGFCLAVLWADAVNRLGDELTVSSTMSMTDPSFGDDAVWWRLGGERTNGTIATTSVADFVVVRTDRVVSEFVFSGSPDGVSIDVQRQVVQAHTGRVRQQLDALGAVADACEPDSESSDTTDSVDTADTSGASQPCPPESGSVGNDDAAVSDGG